MQYGMRIECSNDKLSVYRIYYQSNNGTCTGEQIHDDLLTDNTNLFKCSLSKCENNYMKIRRYDDCNISYADYLNYNMITGQCFYDIEDETNYMAICDEPNIGDAFRYGYDHSG